MLKFYALSAWRSNAVFSPPAFVVHWSDLDTLSQANLCRLALQQPGFYLRHRLRVILQVGEQVAVNVEGDLN